MTPDPVIARELALDPAEFIGVLERSGLGERRPLADAARIAAMCKHANLIVTARDAGKLIGVARCVTDFAYCCYCSDLAVDKAYQGRGLGKALLQATRAELHPKASLYLISAPAAVGFYEAIGMERSERAFGFVPPNRFS
ncbi:MAG: GNAT family N-acetyltransferase [Hyphomicrobiales bacterium]|nr:GNAT family N-acetyltransferase [Hyphomicrobiales bacterium]